MRFPHFLLLGALLFEIFELEIIPFGPVHHVLDALVVLAYSFAVSRISRSRGWGWAVLALGTAPWLVDLLDIPSTAFDAESALWTCFHGAVALALGKRIFRARTVGTPEIVDSISLYLVGGIMFANIYGLVLWAHPGALAHSGTPPGETIEYSLVLYYSFVTQLTVGYGDISPAHSLLRTLSVLQSLFGVLYVAILIARFVSLQTAQFASGESDGGGN